LPGYRYVDGAGTPVTGGLKGVQGLRKDPRDIDEAKRILSEAGYPDGFEVTLSARNAVGYPDEAAILAEQLKKIGIRATLKTYESAAGYKTYDTGDFQFMVQGRSLSLMDPDVVYAQWVNSTMTRWGAGGAPGANFHHPAGFEELYKEQSQELDLEKRKAIVREMEDILMNQDAQYINLFWGARAFPVATQIQNFHLHPSHYMGTKWEHLWCDPVDACR
jgi:peptide/nickel transport system substrate-binding protein